MNANQRPGVGSLGAGNRAWRLTHEDTRRAAEVDEQLYEAFCFNRAIVALETFREQHAVDDTDLLNAALALAKRVALFLAVAREHGEAA